MIVASVQATRTKLKKNKKTKFDNESEAGLSPAEEEDYIMSRHRKIIMVSTSIIGANRDPQTFMIMLAGLNPILYTVTHFQRE